MSPRLSRRACLRRRRTRAALTLGLVLTSPALAPAQTIDRGDKDRIDITGRQNLTLGSGARAYGMGGAFLARADDATAASWNPAGLSYLRQPEVSLVGATNSFRISRGSDRDTFDGHAIDFAAVTWPVALREARGAVQLSYQRALSFEGTRRIRFYNASGQLDQTEDGESKGGFDVVALGTGFHVSRSVRLGFTVNRWINGYRQTLERTLLKETTARPRRVFDLNFRPSGWNFHFGAMWSPVDALNLAAVYKTAFSGDVALDKGRRDYWGPLGLSEEVTSNSFGSRAVELDLPSAFGLGMSWRPRDTVTLSADFTQTRWSQASITRYFDVYATGRSSEDGTPSIRPGPCIYASTVAYPTLSVLGSGTGCGSDPTVTQQDSQQLRVGVEWVLIAGSVKVPLRTGYFSDRQILPDYKGRAPRFNGFTAGIGLVLGSVLLDVAYVHEAGKYLTLSTEVAGGGDFDVVPTPTTTTTLNSVTTNRAYASISYRFSGRP